MVVNSCSCQALDLLTFVQANIYYMFKKLMVYEAPFNGYIRFWIIVVIFLALLMA